MTEGGKKEYIPPPIPQTEAELQAQLDPYFDRIEGEHAEQEREKNKSEQVKRLERMLDMRREQAKKDIVKAFERYEREVRRGAIININYLRDEILQLMEQFKNI